MERKIILHGLSDKEAAALNRFHRCDCIFPVDDSQVIVDDAVIPDNSVQDILRTIFKIDPDGNFSGDLSALEGDKIRPEIKQFIMDNLLKVQQSVKSYGLSDDDLFALSPVLGDSVESYAERCRDYLSKLNEKSNEDS